MRRLTATVAIPTWIALVLIIAYAQSAQAQGYSALHYFTGGQDGANPVGGLTIDNAGNLYGTASSGGTGNGTVFKLTHKSDGWLLSPLYSFAGGNDGSLPWAKVAIGPNGTLYGTTALGGGTGCGAGAGCGTVFNVRPFPTVCKTALCSWEEAVLYSFQGTPDGGRYASGVTFDQTGNMYLTTFYGGAYDCGAVIEVMPSNGGWTDKVLYSFTCGNDGASPTSGVIFDQAGNLYGTAAVSGPYTCGTAFELSPNGHGGWTENTLYAFGQNQGDGCVPISWLIFDQSGNLYGATQQGGLQGGGTVFELSPSNGSWTETVLTAFTGLAEDGPDSGLTMNAGNLYGATAAEGIYGDGTVYKLTPSSGGWIETDLYDFTGHDDGEQPGGVVLDANGNVYGATYQGGGYGYGVVFKITP